MSNRYALFALLATKNLNLTLGQGNGPLAACVYVMFAIVARTLINDSRLAREFSRLAMALDDRKGRAHTGLITFVDAWFINHWVNPVGHAIESCVVGAEAAEQAGDILYSCYAQATAVDLLAQTGGPLEQVVEAAEAAINRMGKRVLISRFHCILERQFALALAGRTLGPSSLSDDTYDESRDLDAMRRTANNNQVAYLATYKLRLCYVHGQIEEALAHAEEAQAIRHSLAGQTAEYNLTVFHALALLDPSGTGAARLDAVRRHIATVERWAEDCPVNFRHKLLLLKAEFARAEGRFADAMPLYEEAIRGPSPSATAPTPGWPASAAGGSSASWVTGKVPPEP